MTLKREIIDAVDTGAGIESIVKDVLNWTNEYTEEQIIEEVNRMVEIGVMENRGPYLVFMWRNEYAKCYVYGVDK